MTKSLSTLVSLALLLVSFSLNAKIAEKDLFNPRIMAKKLNNEKFAQYYPSFLELLSELDKLADKTGAPRKKTAAYHLLLNFAWAADGGACYNAGWIAKLGSELTDVTSCKGKAGDFNPAELGAALGVSARSLDSFTSWSSGCPAGQVACHPLVGGWGADNSKPVCSRNSTSACTQALKNNPEQLEAVKKMLVGCYSPDRPTPAAGAPAWMDCSFVHSTTERIGEQIVGECKGQAGAGHKKVCQSFVKQAGELQQEIVSGREALKKADAEAGGAAATSAMPAPGMTKQQADELMRAADKDLAMLNDPSCLPAVSASMQSQLPKGEDKKSLFGKVKPGTRSQPSNTWLTVMQAAANKCSRSLQDMIGMYGVCTTTENQDKGMEALDNMSDENRNKFYQGFCQTSRQNFIKTLNMTPDQAKESKLNPMRFLTSDSSFADLKVRGWSKDNRNRKAATNYFKECFKEATAIDFTDSGAVASVSRKPQLGSEFEISSRAGSGSTGCRFVATTMAEVDKSDPPMEPVFIMDGKCLGPKKPASEGAQSSILELQDNGAVPTKVYRNRQGEAFAMRSVGKNSKDAKMESTEETVLKVFAYKCGMGSGTPAGVAPGADGIDRPSGVR